MAFIKHNWVTGELVTAALLNRMEEGISEISQGDIDATQAECDALFENFLDGAGIVSGDAYVNGTTAFIPSSTVNGTTAIF